MKYIVFNSFIEVRFQDIIWEEYCGKFKQYDKGRDWDLLKICDTIKYMILIYLYSLVQTITNQSSTCIMPQQISSGRIAWEVTRGACWRFQ